MRGIDVDIGTFMFFKRSGIECQTARCTYALAWCDCHELALDVLKVSMSSMYR